MAAERPAPTGKGRAAAEGHRGGCSSPASILAPHLTTVLPHQMKAVSHSPGSPQHTSPPADDRCVNPGLQLARRVN